MQQRTNEWYEARAGKVTASRIADVMSRTKTGYSATRKNYMAQLVCERLTGQVAESYKSAEMQRGIDLESEARMMYELETFSLVTECGFYIAPDIPESGSSPDGLVGDSGLIEIKCPNTSTHIETLLSDKIDTKYILQMHWQMYSTGRAWCDFVSYDNRMPEGLQLYIKRVSRDDKLIEEIKTEVVKFLGELNEQIKKLKALKGVA